MSNKKKMNLPNKLTVLRMLLVPVFIIVMMLPDSVLPSMWSGIIGIALFIIASLTDMLDGKIARKYNLITDFGKLMDPLADKFMVIGALTVIVYRYESIRPLFIWALLVVVFRELAVTSVRLVASSSGGVVIAANMLGKIKTVTQILCICSVVIEPLIYSILAVGSALPTWWTANVPVTYVTCIAMMILTLWSGINYITAGWKYIDPDK